MNRRDLLMSSLAVPMAVKAAKALASSGEPPNEWEAVRSLFDVSKDRVHLSGFFLASHPKHVRAAIDRHRAGLDADPVGYWEQNHEKNDEQVRSTAAAYLDAKPDEIALTFSTTTGLGLVLNGLKLGAGQEILATTHDHYSSLTSLEHRAARDGTKFRTVPLYTDPESATAQGMVDAIVKAVGPKTRLVHVTWVHSCSGVKVPVRGIADALAKLNLKRKPDDKVLLSVDGVHGFASEETSMPALGCDFFIAGTHKWLFGPRGTGFVWGKSDAWPLVQPIIPTFDGLAYPMWMGVVPKGPIPRAIEVTPGGFQPFEHRWAVAEAFKWHQGLGKAKVAARIHALNRQFKEGLAALPHVRLRTPMSDELSCGIDCFEVKGMTPQQVVEKLNDARITASVTPYRVLYARASFGLLNCPAEVEKTLAVIRGLAKA
jgi:selenocysteine lyase/cysteine desulfurase